MIWLAYAWNTYTSWFVAAGAQREKEPGLEEGRSLAFKLQTTPGTKIRGSVINSNLISLNTIVFVVVPFAAGSPDERPSLLPQHTHAPKVHSVFHSALHQRRLGCSSSKTPQLGCIDDEWCQREQARLEGRITRDHAVRISAAVRRRQQVRQRCQQPAAWVE
jgi:hypothetical protein